MDTPGPGIYHDVPFTDYLAWDAMDKTSLAEFAENPGRYLWKKKNHIVKQTASLNLGTAIDTLLFDGEDAFNERFAVKPMGHKGSTREGKEWLADHALKRHLKFEEYERVKKAVSAVKDYPPASVYLEGCQAQISILWIDPDTELLMKARPDIVPADPSVLADLKSAESAAKDDFARAIRRFKYHWQAAIYTDGWNIVSGNDPLEKFVFVVTEPEPPFVTEVYKLDDDDLETGRLEYKEALKFYAECRKADNFPLSSGIETEISISTF